MKNYCIVPTCGNVLVTVVISTNETNFQMILSLLSDKNSSASQKSPFEILVGYVR